MSSARASDDRSRLFEKVTASAGSVAVYDVSTPAIVAASRLARHQLGFVDVDLADVNIVDTASDPDGTRQLCGLIRDGYLEEWKASCWLRTLDGERTPAFGTGRAVDVEGRRFGLVWYPPISETAGLTPPTLTRDASGLNELSPREVEIVNRMLRGERVAMIARALSLSASTVRNHLSSVYRKLGIHSQTELIEVLKNI